MPVYRLQEGSIQDQFHASRAKIQIFGGAYANGKTTAAVLKALKLARDYPGSNGLIARATYPKLNDTIRKVFLEWCPAHWIKKRPTQDDNTVYLVNGSIVNFRYISQRGKKTEDGSTTSNLLSATYDWIVVDQMEDPEIEYKDFVDLAGRLRGQTPYRPVEEDVTMPSSGPRWFIVTCNPTANWFYKLVVKPYKLWKDQGLVTEELIVDPNSGKPLIELFEGDLYSNRANLPEDYIRAQENLYKGQMAERYIKGKWASFEGLVYPSFDEAIHMPKREDIIDHLYDCLKRHVSVYAVESYDFGNTSPSCYMLGFVDDYSRVFVVDGYYKGNFNYEDQPEEIRKIRFRYQELEFKEGIRADPSIFKRTVVAGKKQSGDTISKLYKADGIVMKPASNNVQAGIAKVNTYLNGHPAIPHFLTGERPGPLLYIAQELRWFHDEAVSYYWKKNPFGQYIDEPQDHNDHAMDCAKYLLSKQPKAADIVLPKKTVFPEWLKWHEYDDAA